MSALNQQKNIKDPESLQVLLRLFCAVLDRVGRLSDPNGLNDLEYRWAANDEEKESEKPRSDAEFFLAGLLEANPKAKEITLVLSQRRLIDEIFHNIEAQNILHLNSQVSN